MLRIKVLFALSICMSAAAYASDAQPAAALKPASFEQDGVRYEYRARLHGDIIEIRGASTKTGDAFSLFVRPSGAVEGEFGGQPVRYMVRKSARDRLAARLKAPDGISVAEASKR